MDTNELNLSLQGRNTFIFITRDRISSFQHKLSLWTRSVESKKSECFPNGFLAESETRIEETVFSDMIKHLNGLQHTFFNYFPVITNDPSWVGNPFSVMEITQQHVSARL
jgi:hypothetical protein